MPTVHTNNAGKECRILPCCEVWSVAQSPLFLHFRQFFYFGSGVLLSLTRSVFLSVCCECLKPLLKCLCFGEAVLLQVLQFILAA